MIIKIQTAWKTYRDRAYSYFKALKLDEYPVIYYLKE